MIISAQDSAYRFLSSLFFSLAIPQLSDYARLYGENGRLPVLVNFCLDEYCNIGYMDGMADALNSIRGFNMSCQIVVQSLSQWQEKYPGKEWENQKVQDIQQQPHRRQRPEEDSSTVPLQPAFDYGIDTGMNRQSKSSQGFWSPVSSNIFRRRQRGYLKAPSSGCTTPRTIALETLICHSAGSVQSCGCWTT